MAVHSAPGAFARRTAPFAGCPCCFGPAAAAAEQVNQSNTLPDPHGGFRRLSVGSVKCFPLQDAVGAMSVGSVFADADMDAISGFLNVDGNLEMSFGCVLLQSAGLNVLCDTSCGDVTQVAPQPQSRPLPDLLLAAAGLTPADIDIITFSHAHGDHVAGAVRYNAAGDLEPTFPNARHLIREPELASVQGSDTYPTYFAPLEAAGLLEVLPPEGDYALTDEVVLQSGFVRSLPAPSPLPSRLSHRTHTHTPRASALWVAGGSHARAAGDPHLLRPGGRLLHRRRAARLSPVRPATLLPVLRL